MVPRKTHRLMRTNDLIDRFRGLPNEFYLLKGVLIATNGWGFDDIKRFNALIDTSLIAARMDALNNEARDRMQAELDGIRDNIGPTT